ncbi:MAG TPA: nuclear transport factor 2 family protein [Allosphingosinicella sp.]|jgi:ketosteroid isomerase-like protein|nr:nuclear transport factor 2 family protein [Allosphingosinicella sp.]
MRIVHQIIFCLLVATSQSAFADAAADVRAANDRWTVAMKSKDMTVVQSLVGPEFVLTRGQASAADERVERAAWIANLRQMSFAVYKANVTDVQVTGDFAVATVDGDWTVTQNGRTRSGPFRVYDIWFKRTNGWQVIRRHQVSAPTPAVPARP